MELIALANMDDVIVGSQDRSEQLPPHLCRCISAAVVFNSRGELVLQKVARTKKYLPLSWTYSATGHVDAGETYEQAAHRELQEELGIETDLEFLAVSNFYNLKGELRSFHHVFKGIHDGPYVFDPNETEEIRLFNMAELKEQMAQKPSDFNPNLIEIVTKYL